MLSMTPLIVELIPVGMYHDGVLSEDGILLNGNSHIEQMFMIFLFSLKWLLLRHTQGSLCCEHYKSMLQWIGHDECGRIGIC
jgi:hypothetical protein